MASAAMMAAARASAEMPSFEAVALQELHGGSAERGCVG